MRHVIAVVLFGLCCNPTSSFGQFSGPSAKEQQETERITWLDRVQAVRTCYKDFSPKILGLEEPIVVTEVQHYFDGGTLSFQIVDKNGESLHVAMGLVGHGGKSLGNRFPEVSATRYYYGSVFVGAKHPRLEDAVPLPTRGPEEAAIYGLLLRWEARLRYKLDDMKSKVAGRLMHRVLEGLDIRFAWREGLVPSERYNNEWPELEGD